MEALMTIAVATMLCAAPPTAKEKQAFEKGYAVGKDIAKLQEDVAELKAIVEKLVKLDRQRDALLRKLIAGESVELPATVEVTPPSPSTGSTPRPAKAPAKKKRGRVTGKITTPPGMGPAYVYINNAGGRPVKGRVATIKQKNRKFAPRHLVVQRGTTVVFPNEDSIYHNVFARDPKASFDLGIYRAGDKPRSYTFSKPGEIDVYCNMHKNMHARVLVVPNRMYTRVAADGTFTLPRVPAGRRELVAWAPGAKAESVIVRVTGDRPASANLTLTAAPFKQHTNKLGKPYGSYGR